jgi:predicted glycosyltransferase
VISSSSFVPDFSALHHLPFCKNSAAFIIFLFCRIAAATPPAHPKNFTRRAF